jgi:hypothetical protein
MPKRSAGGPSLLAYPCGLLRAARPISVSCGTNPVGAPWQTPKSLRLSGNLRSRTPGSTPHDTTWLAEGLIFYLTGDAARQLLRTARGPAWHEPCSVRTFTGLTMRSRAPGLIAQHLVAQRRGREVSYSDYQVRVQRCTAITDQPMRCCRKRELLRGPAGCPGQVSVADSAAGRAPQRAQAQ